MSNLLEKLRDEMKVRGCTPATINSKAVAVVLDIVSNSGDAYTTLWEKESATSRRIQELEREVREIERKKRRIDNTIASTQEKIDELISVGKEVRDYVELFHKSLSECETEEGRDAMRRAQVFVNSVEVNTKYDNTAFIASLGAILSDGKIGAIGELKKINPKIPTIDAISKRITAEF